MHGATVAVDRFNKTGGVLGRPITIFEADDTSKVDTAVRAARKLIKDDRVDALMGTFNGDVALAVAEVAKQESRLFMVTGAHVPELTGSGCNTHTFVFMPSARMLSRAVTPHLVKAYGNRWFMITADTMDGRAAEQAMAAALQAEGGEVVGSIRTPFGTTDFTGAIAKARASKPGAVVLNLYGWDLVHALKAYAAAGLAKEQIGMGGMIGGEQIGRPLGYADNAGILGADLGPESQLRGVATVHSERRRQVSPYAHLPVLSRLRRHDADSGSGPAGRDDRHAGRDQGAGVPHVRWPEGRTVLLSRLGSPARAGCARGEGLRQGVGAGALSIAGHHSGRRGGRHSRPERVRALGGR